MIGNGVLCVILLWVGSSVVGYDFGYVLVYVYGYLCVMFVVVYGVE